MRRAKQHGDTHMGDNHRGNGYDGEKIEKFLTAIDKLDDELMTLKGEYMASCRGPRQRIKDVLARVRENDVNMVAFRELLRSHRDDRPRQARLDALEADDQDADELLLGALGEFGETELGKAALSRARPRSDGDQTLNSL
jgi:hypothetical protein